MGNHNMVNNLINNRMDNNPLDSNHNKRKDHKEITINHHQVLVPNIQGYKAPRYPREELPEN